MFSQQGQVLLFIFISKCFLVEDMLEGIFYKASNPSFLGKVISECKRKFDLYSFQIEDLTSDKAHEIYSSLSKKYQLGECSPAPTAWHENERRIFIWFMLFYCYEHQIQPHQIAEEEWDKFSCIFFGKDPLFLQFQARNLERPHRRVNWNTQENHLLRQMVYFRKFGVKRWNDISKQIYFNSKGTIFRTAKQCRERWFNHLDSSIKKSQMSAEEDFTILTYVKENGKKWSNIATLFQRSRTEHQIKNRFNALLNKYKKEFSQSGDMLDFMIQQVNKKKLQKSNSEEEGVNKQQADQPEGKKEQGQTEIVPFSPIQVILAPGNSKGQEEEISEERESKTCGESKNNQSFFHPLLSCFKKYQPTL